jgi:ankyrin repeat protein
MPPDNQLGAELPLEPEAAAATKVHLADIIADAAVEDDVLSWMSANNVKRSDLSRNSGASGAAALQLAVRKCMLLVTGSLLQAQAPMADTDSSGDTALHWACLRSKEVPGMLAVLEQLLEAGADANAIGDLDNTPLHLACAANCPAVRRSASRSGCSGRQ